MIYDLKAPCSLFYVYCLEFLKTQN